MSIELEPLRKAGLYIDDPDDDIREKISPHAVNRLLSWGDMKLYDMVSDPLPSGYSRTEKLRNITLTSTFAKIVKKYPDVVVTIPYGYKRILNRIIGKELNKKYVTQVVEDVVVEQTDSYTVRKVTEVKYYSTIEPKMKERMLMKDLYQEYLSLPASSEWINSFFNTQSKSNILFRFTPPDTNYQIGFFFNGDIVSIKVNAGQEPTAQEIIEMSNWANQEFKDIVTSAKVCKEIEEEEKPEEPELTTSYECSIK